MANFNISKDFTKDIEGGFWDDPSAGWTYAGVTRKYFPFWPGFARLEQLRVKYYPGKEIPRTTVFKDQELDKYVSTFYKENFWNRIFSGDLIKNQTIADFIYDFIVHKQYAAVNVINQAAIKTDPTITKVSKTNLTQNVIDSINKNPSLFYENLRAGRINYYKTSKLFSPKFKIAYVKRVNRFPESIAGLQDQPYLINGVNDKDFSNNDLSLALDKQRLEIEQNISRKRNSIGSLTDTAYQTEIESHVAALNHIAGVRGFFSFASNLNSKVQSKFSQKTFTKPLSIIRKRKSGLLSKVWNGVKKSQPLKMVAKLAAAALLPKIAPFFLYLFIDENLVSKFPTAVQAKRSKALKYKKFIVEKLSINEGNFTKSIRNGIMSKYGQSPETVISSWVSQTGYKIGSLQISPQIAGSDILKTVFGSILEKAKADFKNNAPAIEDFGNINSPGERNNLSNLVQSQATNNDPIFSKGSVTPSDNGDYFFRDYQPDETFLTQATASL